MEKKRLTSKKAGLAELSSGRFIKKGGFESSYVLTNLGRRLSRVRILGLVVDKFESEDGKYATITLDDGGDTLRCKAFINVKLFDSITKGTLVDVMGKVREYNGEVYVAPETVRKADANWETLRALELKRIWAEQRQNVKKVRDLQKKASDRTELITLAKKEGMDADDAEGILEAQEADLLAEEQKISADRDVKERVMKSVETLDTGTGADYSDILKHTGLAEAEVDSAIQELLESGVCFEPKAGRIKKL